MESRQDHLIKFLRLFRSFQCPKIPSDLWYRACESRPTWSSTGEIIERVPREAGVPEWFLEFYSNNRSLFHDAEQRSQHEFFKSTTENGVTYLQVTSAGQIDLGFVDEVTLARDRIAIVLQAFPSINAEIIGEEIIDRLMDVVKTSILPLLSSLREADFEFSLLPRVQEGRESYLVSLLELLLHVIDTLGIESPLAPLSLLRQISNVISKDRINNISVAWEGISQFLDSYTGNNVFSSFESFKTTSDQRNNALAGHMLALLLSNETWLGEHQGSDKVLIQARSDWQPLSSSNPSTMEYLVAASFCGESPPEMTESPPSLTVDATALRGLLISRKKQFRNAAMILDSAIEGITSKYGPTSMHLGIILAELANCYNILRLEDKAEACVIETLHEQQGRNISARRDIIYLRIALADSYIGRARYNEAIPLLQSIIDRHDIPATLRMMSILRLARSQRRMNEDTHRAFEENSPLWTGVTLLSHVTGVLVMEYVEELACQISETPKQQQEDSLKIPKLIEAVDSAICRSNRLTDSPCWEWFMEVQQKYLGRMTEAKKKYKGKETNDGTRSEDEDVIGILPSSRASSCPTPQPHGDISDDKRPWSEMLLLSFDGGGVRALSSLFILRRIMDQIREFELVHPDGPAYTSSSSLLSSCGNTAPGISEESGRNGEFLPCHYFDYITGTSTGGLISIMLGRLGMSVEQAIDNFIDFGNAVFGHPRNFTAVPNHNTSGAKYSAIRARDAFQNIIMRKSTVGLEDKPDPDSFTEVCRRGTFREDGGRTKTIVISSKLYEDAAGVHFWRSRGGVENKSATIWEVARATTSDPVYFDPIEINGVLHFDGGFLAKDLLSKVLQDLYLEGMKSPAVCVTIGTGFEAKATRKRVGRWRDLPAIRKLNQFFKAANTEDNTKLFTEGVTKGWMELNLNRAYRLDVKGDLHKMLFDDWRPAHTGSTTVQEITDITNDYLRKDIVGDIIKRIALEAVRIRRARAMTKLWKAFVEDPRIG